MNNKDKSQISWMIIIKFCLFIQIILAIINTLVRSDFLNVIIPFVIVIGIGTSTYSTIRKIIDNCILLLILNIFYDIIWLMFTSSVKLNNLGLFRRNRILSKS